MTPKYSNYEVCDNLRVSHILQTARPDNYHYHSDRLFHNGIINCSNIIDFSESFLVECFSFP